MKNSGFTLVEISIVIVIIALIVGGIIVGQDLVRAAQLRQVTKEFEQYITVINTFKTKYNCLPGDCPSATALGLGSNGNGDGSWGTNDGDYSEMYKIWPHLAAADLISGSFTGLVDIGPGGGTPGLNIPQSTIESAGWGVRYFSTNVSGQLWGGAISKCSFNGKDYRPMFKCRISCVLPGTFRRRGL